MTATYQSWPGPARTMALAVDAAVSATQSHDATAFADALAALGRVDGDQLVVLLGAVTRELVERAYPDGLDSDDAEDVLQSCIPAAAWYEPLDSDSLTWALTGALGVNDPDESHGFDGPAVLAHGLLLIADLLTNLKHELPPVLEGALGELKRAQTVELP